jgi:putative NADH-flavin reductase
MKIALIGATGYVGSTLLQEALNRGHEVTALARHPEKLTPHPRLSMIKVDVLADNNISELLTDHDVVMSAFNAFNSGLDNAHAFESQIIGTKHILASAKKARLARVLMVGGAGSLEVTPGLRVVDTPDFPEQWKDMALAMGEVLTILKDELDLDWTLLSPSALLQPGIRTGQFRLGRDQLITDNSGNSHISVEDYAVAMIDEMEVPKHSRMRFTAGY